MHNDDGIVEGHENVFFHKIYLRLVKIKHLGLCVDMQALINYLISNELLLIEDAVTSLNDFVETREVKLTKNFHVFPRKISHDLRNT